MSIRSSVSFERVNTVGDKYRSHIPSLFSLLKKLHENSTIKRNQNRRGKH